MQNEIQISCAVTEHVSDAYHEDAIPVIHKIVAKNASNEDIVDVQLKIENLLAIVEPLTLCLDRVPSGAKHHTANADVRLEAPLLAAFAEASRRQLTMALEDAGAGAIAQNKLPVTTPTRVGDHTRSNISAGLLQ